MEWFFALVGLMVIIALIRLRSGSTRSNDHAMGENQQVHYWMHHDPGVSDSGGGFDNGSIESGGSSFDGGSSDGGGGDSSGF